MQVLHIENVEFIIDLQKFLTFLERRVIWPKHIFCFKEDTIRRLVLKNVSYIFDYRESDTLNSSYVRFILNEVIPKAIYDINKLELRCNYQKLREIDLSISSTRSSGYMFMLTGFHIYPELQTLNLSYSGIKQIPLKNFHQWRFYFQNLSFLDLSYNNIEEIDYLLLDHDWNVKEERTLYVNISHNNITQIRAEIVEKLVNFPHLFLNFSYNPINCSCTEVMETLLRLVNNKAKWSQTKYRPYLFLLDMECEYPKHFKGRHLKELSSENLHCQFDRIDILILEPVIFLSVFVLILIMAIIFLTKYKEEVEILFIRFNVFPSCVGLTRAEEKVYDAFVAYSSKDTDWVRSVFERTNSNVLQQFNFCMHHNDFVPGRTIHQNIINSIQLSRHTIIILSNHFLQSAYCMYEFQEAYKQSLEESTCLLILVLMEEIPKGSLTRELKTCLRTLNYIKKTDSRFYSKLQSALASNLQ
ncbi:toll-like receptor 4 [Saccostrea echinata]|uniref:toll-like receptor 4 n=1 Tax=Saccostrea echinata TaxID=191078 RepID=UPI002A83EC3D|nr:toll-like receptor 4 [Saccostrea echinata]